MGLDKLTLSVIERMDHGKPGAMFASHLKKVVEDIEDRPGDKTARTITFKATFSPTGDQGVVDDVKVSFTCNSSVPANQTREYSMAPDHGQLLYNDVSRTNVNQRTLDQANEPKKDARPGA